jgi:hypothetical protein
MTPSIKKLNDVWIPTPNQIDFVIFKIKKSKIDAWNKRSSYGMIPHGSKI